jgi:hypothetical protein
LVEESEGGEEEVVLYPIECNPRAHTAVVLFEQTPEMADAYLSVFERAGQLDARKNGPVYPRMPTKSYFWIGHDVVSFGVLPTLDAFAGQASWRDVFREWAILVRHVLFWKEGTYTFADPWPFLVLYHVYWPMKFAASLWKGQIWSRINVSTTKVFEG